LHQEDDEILRRAADYPAARSLPQCSPLVRDVAAVSIPVRSACGVLEAGVLRLLPHPARGARCTALET